MKIKLHIPVEQYGFVEADFEYSESQNIQEAYETISRQFKPQQEPLQPELSRQEWNILLDKYRQGKKMTVDEMNSMGKAQAWLIKELDKSNDRLSNSATH